MDSDYKFLTLADVELFEGIEDSGDVQGLAVLVDAAIERHLNIERTWMSVILGHTIASLRIVAKQVADR